MILLLFVRAALPGPGRVYAFDAILTAAACLEGNG